jgi:hypothetical protein
MVHKPLETQELKLRKEGRSKIQTKVNKPQKKEKKHRIVIIGDSHARGCAAELKSNLDVDFETQGFINPGTGLKTIITSAKRDIQQLTKQDVVVMWGGSKDVGRNEKKQGINWIRNFVETNKHTNIILMEVPHRYDLIEDSCVNKEVVKFNHIIRKRMKAHANVEVMKVNVDRGAFTKHGQHMNATGKEVIAKKIAESIKHTLEACKRTPLIMKWKKDTSHNNQDPGKTKNGDRDEGDPTEHQKDNIQVQENNSRQQEKEAVVITPRRSQKTPVARSENFLWTGKEVMTKKTEESIKHTSEMCKKIPSIVNWKEDTSHDNQGPEKTKN